MLEIPYRLNIYTYKIGNPKGQPDVIEILNESETFVDGKLFLETSCIEGIFKGYIDDKGNTYDSVQDRNLHIFPRNLDEEGPWIIEWYPELIDNKDKSAYISKGSFQPITVNGQSQGGEDHIKFNVVRGDIFQVNKLASLGIIIAIIALIINIVIPLFNAIYNTKKRTETKEPFGISLLRIGYNK